MASAQIDFELAMYAVDPSLQISVFDHTVKLANRKEFKFYPWGLSNVTKEPIHAFGDITAKLGHTHIDVLKVIISNYSVWMLT